MILLLAAVGVDHDHNHSNHHNPDCYNLCGTDHHCIVSEAGGIGPHNDHNNHVEVVAGNGLSRENREHHIF